MCCRFLFGLEDDEELYGYVEKMEIMYRKLYPSIPFPRGEIFPSDTVCVYLQKKGKITLQNMKWGFSSSLSKDLIINAKSETLKERVMFKNILGNRCVILANAFFEWSQDASHQKYIFRRKNEPIYLAGLYKEDHFVIITKEACGVMKDIHSRMPLILEAKDVKNYLLGDNFFNSNYINNNPPLRKEICL